MESLGEKLKAAREQKGCTFDQVARETNIAARYLEALEREDFSPFPGEPYLLGFLRNYGDYLGLEAQELIAAYRTIKIQEQPIPVEQLLKKGPSVPVPLVAAAAAAVVVAGAGIAFFVLSGNAAPAAAAPSARIPSEYALADGALERRLYAGDSVLAASGSSKFKVVLSSLGKAATLSAPSGDLVVELGQELEIDLDGDGANDLSVFVADLLRDDPSKGALLRFQPLAAAAAPGDALPAVSAAPAPEPVAAASPGSPVILSSPNPYPFTLQATFRGYCLLRWEADRKDREERYFHKAETLNVQAQNGIRLWISNAGAVKLTVVGGGKTVDVDVGGSGEVVVSDLKWVKDDDGRYKLTTQRLE